MMQRKLQIIEDFLGSLMFHTEWKPFENLILGIIECAHGEFFSKNKTIDKIGQYIIGSLCFSRKKFLESKARILISDIRYNIVRFDLLRVLDIVKRKFNRMAC